MEYPIQQQEEQQQHTAEWCEHDPDDVIEHLRGRDYTFSYTWKGAAPQHIIDALPAPHGKIRGKTRDYVVNVDPPAGGFVWALTLVVKDNATGHPYCTQTYGDFFAPLPPDRAPLHITVDLP